MTWGGDGDEQTSASLARAEGPGVEGELLALVTCEKSFMVRFYEKNSMGGGDGPIATKAHSSCEKTLYGFPSFFLFLS